MKFTAVILLLAFFAAPALSRPQDEVEIASIPAVAEDVEVTTISPVLDDDEESTEAVTEAIEENEIQDDDEEEVEATTVVAQAKVGVVESEMDESEDVETATEVDLIQDDDDEEVAATTVSPRAAEDEEEEIESTTQVAEEVDHISIRHHGEIGRVNRKADADPDNIVDAFIFSTFTSTVTSTKVVVTNIITTWSSCYATAVAMGACSSVTSNLITSTIGSRKKKSSASNWIEEKPVVVGEEGEPTDFNEFIKASKASTQCTSIASTVDQKSDGEDIETSIAEKEGKFLTYETSVTVTATTTVNVTIVANGYQTLRFTSEAANPGCLPADLLASLNLGPC